MAHKALIGGTAYGVTGGKTLIGGTEYSITKGRTLVNGTGYDISFGTWRDRFCRLMANANLVVSAGRNNSSSSYIRVNISSLPVGTYYFFCIAGGNIGINKMVYDGATYTITNLYTSNGNYWLIYRTGSYVYISTTGTSYDSNTNGGGLFAFTFTGFEEANIDALLTQFTVQNVTYRDNTTTGYVRVADTTTNALLVQYGGGTTSGRIGLSYPYGTVIFGNYTTNPSLLCHTTSYYSISVDGTSADTAYGANIFEL